MSDSHSGRGPRLLIVDDDEHVRRSLHRVLAKDHTITGACDGRQAREVLTQQRFDVVLSDIGLPDTTGVELLRLIRGYDLDVPVVLMTGQPTVETAIEAMDLGAFAYLTKPIDNSKLRDVLHRAAKLARLARMKREALAVAGEGALAGDRAGLTASFERALDSAWIAFQPIVAARGERTVAFEALLRCDEPTMPHPGVMLTAAERLGRLDDLGRRSRARAAASFSTAAVSADAMLFVNLHSADLNDPDLYSPMAPLARHARRVVLEITERASLDGVRDVRGRIALLRQLGYRIAIDDLGAGYAGLSSFAALEPEFVKLDMSLVRGVDASPVRSRIVQGITELCRSLQMQVVAEGIETPEEMTALRSLGCDLFQGYLFGRPARELVAGKVPAGSGSAGEAGET